MKLKIGLLSADFRNFKTLLVSNKSTLIEEIEIRSESDKDLGGAQVLIARTFAEALNLMGKHQFNLCIYDDQVDKHDFVFLQQNFLKSNPEIQLIPLLSNTINLMQINESQRAGQVFMYGESSQNWDYDYIKNMLLNAIRAFMLANHKHDQLEEFMKVREALLINREEWKSIKQASFIMLGQLIVGLDFDAKMKQKIELAEFVYLPWLNFENYQQIFKGIDPVVLNHLNASGDWSKLTAPQSQEGLLITLSNYCCMKLEEGVVPEKIVEEYNKRPQFLKHKSMRAINEEKLSACLQMTNNIKITKAA